MSAPRHIEEHRVTWRGLLLRISYEPHWLQTQADLRPAHLQIETLEPARAPLPITETGYLSWFTSPALVSDMGGPVAFVLRWLDAEANGPHWLQADAARQQLDLFC